MLEHTRLPRLILRCPSGAASEAGDGAQRGGPEQGEAAEEPAGAQRVHAHAEDHAELYAQPLQGEFLSCSVCTRTPSHTLIIMHTQTRGCHSPPEQHLVTLVLCFLW